TTVTRKSGRPRHKPLFRAGPFVTPTELLAQSSLDDDGPSSTGGFLCANVSSAGLPPARFPFFPGSRFAGSIIAITRQYLLATPNNDRHRFVTAVFQHQPQHTLQPTHYRSPSLVYKYVSAYGSFILLPLCCLDKYSC
ncbi:hypothetical protein T07_14295, partial [Trichinella nelsoni]